MSGAERYARLHALLDEARALDGAERAAHVARIRAQDEGLAEELEDLLAALDDARGDRSTAPSDARSLLDDRVIVALRAQLDAAEEGSRAPDWLPERIGDLRILRRIGSGGMGVVYEAEQDAPRRRVAVKMIHPALASSEALRRFRLEGELLGRLHHPGIAQVHECGAFDLGRGPQPYFVMELVEGVDVRSHAERARLDLAARLALVAEIADAVHHAHERGVVHRDLKPENVIVDTAGRPKVLDFGVARASGTSALVSMVTRTGELVGTLAYMAPELLAGAHGGGSARSDVYALGVILYELVSGRLPHEVAGLPITAAVRVLSHEDPPSLGRFDARLRGDVATIAATAMEKDPSRRYASAAALAADLRRHLDHRPIAARPASRAYRLAKFLRRNRTLAAAAAAVLATFVAGLVATLWQAGVAAAERDRAHAFGVEQARLAAAAAAARRESEVQRDLAAASARAASRHAYLANVAAAASSLRERRGLEARVHLEDCASDLRAFEWRYLDAQSDPSWWSMRSSDGAAVLALAATPDGRVRALSQGGWLRTGDARSGEVLSDVRVGAERLSTAALSADGQLAALVPASGPARLVDVDNGREVRALSADGAVVAVAFSADGSHVASAHTGGVVLVHELGSGAPPVVVRAGGPAAPVIALSPDGDRLAFVDDDLWIRVVGARDGRVLSSARPHTHWIRGLAFDARGAMLASASEDATASLWDLASDRSAWRIGMAQQPTSVAARTPDGQGLAAAATDGSVRLFSSRTGELLVDASAHTGAVRALAFVDRDVLTASSDGTVRRFGVRAPATLDVRLGNAAHGIAIAPDATWVATASEDGVVRTWDARSGALLRELAVSRQQLISVAIDPSGALVLAAPFDGAAVLLDAASGDEVRRFVPTRGGTYEGIFGPGGDVVVTSTTAGDVELWDARDGRRLHRLVLHDEAVMQSGFSPDGCTLVTASFDGTAGVWDVASGRRLAVLRGHERALNDAAFDRDGGRILTGGHDCTLRVWDAATFECVAVLPAPRDLGRIRATPDGERILASSGDGSLRVWDARSLEPVAAIPISEGWFLDFVLDARATRLVAGDALGWSSRWTDRPARNAAEAR